MSLSIAAYKLIGAATASTVAVGSTGYAGYVVYQKRYKTTETTSTTNNGNAAETIPAAKSTTEKPVVNIPENVQKQQSDEAVKATPPVEKPVAAKEIPDTNYQYVIAKVSGKNSTDTGLTNLFDDSGKNYTCEVAGVADSDTHCKIFKFNATEGKKHLLDLTQIKSDGSAIKTHSELNDDDLVVLKISNTLLDAYKAIGTGVEKEIKVKKNGEEATYFASLKDLVEINKSHTDTSFDFVSSNLALVKLAEGFTSSEAISASTTFKAVINGTEVEGCKLYKLTDSFTLSSLSTAKFPEITALSGSGDLAQNKYLVLDLGETPKSYKDLEDSSIEIKVGNTKVTAATFEHLLVGKVETTLTGSTIVAAANVHDSSRQTQTLSGTNFHYVVTKASKKSSRTDLAFPTELNGYICRFNAYDGTTYEDNACSVFSLDTADKATINFDDFRGDTAKKIGSLAAFESGKLQVVKVKDTFYNKLTGQNLSFDLIQKTKKDHLWHSKYATLTKEFDLTSAKNESLNAIKTNLALVRLKKKPTSDTKFDRTVSQNALYCRNTETAADTDQFCNIYKFSTSKISNNLTSSDFKDITKWDLESSSLNVGELYVISYTGNTFKGFSDYKTNSKIYASSHNTSTEKLLDFDFDQMLFGQINEEASKESIIFPKTNRTAEFLVELDKTLTTNWVNIEANTNYRCKLSATSGSTTHGTNYDNSCKLVSIPTLTDEKTITESDPFKAIQAPVTQTAIALKDSSKKFFKLIWDPQKMINFDTSKMDQKDYEVELVSTDTTTENVFGKFKIKQKIDSQKFYGKLDMFVVNAKTATEITTGSGKCKFKDVETEFNCTLHSVETATNDARLEKIKVTDSVISSSTTIAVADHYLIKAATPQINKDWEAKKIEFTVSGTTVDFDIKKYVSGSLETSNSELFYLKTNV